MDLIKISVPAIETVIALSIVFLAAEIARSDRQSLTWRRPALVAGGFGLFHGAGFASALASFGLPQTEKISALVFFNLGVEAGQIAFIIGVFALLWALAIIAQKAGRPYEARKAQTFLGYGIGIIAAFWFFERLINALSSPG